MNVYLPYTARLPSTYQEVEYIQSTGNQYIDTGYKYNGTYFRIDIQLMFNSYSYGGTGADCPFICGVIGRSYGNMFLSLGANNHVFGLATGTQYETSIIAQLGTKFDTMLEYKSGTMTFKSNGSTVTTSSTGTFYTGKSIPLFCRWDIQYSGLYSYFCTDMRMYGCKIYSAENTLARDFVPCYRKSDNVIGLYDLINNQFYTNAGTGTFSKGNDVTMAELKNAYIGGVIECDFTQSDYGFTFVATAGPGTITYGRDSNGLWTKSTGAQAGTSWHIPSSIYTIGNLKKAVFEFSGGAANNGGGFGTNFDTKRMRHYTALRLIWGNQNQSGTSENSPAGIWTFTADLENKILSSSISNITMSLQDDTVSAFNTDWTAGSVNVHTLAYTANTYAYIRKITFYF